MKIEDISVSQRGKLVVISHPKYLVEYNLAKGTWNYSESNGKTIIKNGFTHISLTDGTTLKTVNPGFREFRTEPANSDEYGNHQTLHFIYETTSEKHEDPTKQKKSQKNTQSTKDTDNSDVQPDSADEKPSDSDKSGIRIHTYITCYVEQPYILLKVEVENLNTSPIYVTDLTLIEISSQSGSIQLGSHPSQYHLFLKIPPISPSASARHKIYDGFQLNRDSTLQPCKDGILYDTESKKSLVFGFITTQKWWPHIQVGYQASKRKTQQGLTNWALYHDCENTECIPGKTLSSEVGYIDFSTDAHSSYRLYTERLASENTTDTQKDPNSNTDTNQDITQQIFTGWSFSTENLGGNFSAKSIREQIDFISKSPIFNPNLPGGIDYIHLDSGWQPHPGNLKLNPDSFPEGMAPVVEMIHQNGFKAGICIDPFAVEPDDDFVKNNPDTCLRYISTEKNQSAKDEAKANDTNKPVEVHLPNREKALTILDSSHPKTQQYVKKVIRKIVEEWGFDIVKVDFSSYTIGMMTVAPNTTWHDKSLSSAELYRSAVNILTEAVQDTSEDTLLAGYNALESVVIGRFQLNFPLVSQINVDNSDTWHQQNGTKNRLCRYAENLNTHNILWNNVFGELSINEPRPVNEAILEITAAALSGATVLAANTPTEFKTLRTELITKILPLTGTAAKPVDYYDEAHPCIWHLPVETEKESWNIVAIFNWKDQQNDIHLDLNAIGLNPDKDYLVHDFWMRNYLGVVSKNVTLLNIAPRSVKLLCFREQQQIPQLLSTDLHYTQGSVEILSAGWDSHSQSYLIVCQPPRQVEGTFFVHVPEEYIPTGVSAFGSDYQYSWDKPIFQLTFKATDSIVNASIQFMKTEGGSQKL